MKIFPGRSTKQPSEHAQMHMNLQKTELAYYSSILDAMSEAHHQSTAGQPIYYNLLKCPFFFNVCFSLDQIGCANIVNYFVYD